MLLILNDEYSYDILEELYFKYNKKLLYLAKSIVKDEYEAEDIVQTTFIKISPYIDKTTDIDSE